MTELSVAEADFSGNPVIGPFARDGLTRADYRWMVQAWEEVVRPGLRRGLTRDDFAARDAERGVPVTRSIANVHDIFLCDPVQVERRPDGKLGVLNGRHRIEIARELGISTLPGVVIE